VDQALILICIIQKFPAQNKATKVTKHTELCFAPMRIRYAGRGPENKD